MIVGDLMSVVEGVVSPDELLSTAVSSMCKHEQSCIVVTLDDKPVGIITERDIVRIFSSELFSPADGNLQIDRLTVNDVLAADGPVCISLSTSLHDAMILARSRQIRHLLIIDEDGKLAGLVTQTDMVNAYISIVDRQAELETANQALHLLSHEDALMGIGNRRAMEVEMDFTQAYSKRYKKNYSVALMDVDYFKAYNDRYGHQAGDDALIAIANALKGTMRETDRLYRYGGEELLMLMPSTDIGDALTAAERARIAVEELKIPHMASPLEHLTISAGVASSDEEEWQILVDNADTALYQAKDCGRNQTCESDLV
jgi:diguanylate cyclase (GGDEF)-like protein